MAVLRFEGLELESVADETVLDTLLRNGIDVPYSCRKGTCGTCLMRSTGGHAPSRVAQAGLRESQRQQGYFHGCQCIPAGDMEFTGPAEAAATVFAVVSSKDMLGPTVCRLRLSLPTQFSYRAGQSVLLQRDDGLARSYSLASVQALDGHAELHVRLYPDGALSRWIFETLQPGDTITLRGPFGDCVYVPGAEDAPMLLLATGTGLAPLIGVARDALSRGHRGRIVIVHGVRTARDAYGCDMLRNLAASHANVETLFCLSLSPAGQGFEAGRALDVAFERFEDLTGWRVYLCGAPGMVAAAKRAAYLAGARMEHICSDPFEAATRPGENSPKNQ